MTTWRARIRGTINDEIEVDLDTEDENEARELALDAWRYVEFEDLEIDEIERVEREEVVVSGVVTLSPQMEKLLALLQPGRNYTEFSIQPEFYRAKPGAYGYVHAGRGRGTGSIRSTFLALERRGLVERTPYGWRRTS